MFAVGVGNAVEEELREIASEPVADHYFYTADFKTINQIGKKLQKKICVGERAQGLSKGRGSVGNRATPGLSVAWVKQIGTVVAAPARGWLTQYQPRHADAPVFDRCYPQWSARSFICPIMVLFCSQKSKGWRGGTTVDC